MKMLYKPILKFTLKHKITVVLLTIIFFVSSLFLVPHLGTEFIPDPVNSSLIQLKLK